jgi:two-component system, OmpR family, response regulator
LHILVACADKLFLRRLSHALKLSNFSVDEVDTLDDLLSFADFGTYGVIVVDTNLTPENNFDALITLRKKRISVPIFVLSDKREVADRVEGLDQGADDYLCKPFALNEFCARINALSRRKETVYEFNTLSFGDIFLDLKTNELICNEHIVHLGLKEFQIMKLLISNGRQILTKEQLIERVWGINLSSEYNNIEVYISFIRKKIAKLGSNVSIDTIRGIGYRLKTTQN